MEEVANAGIPPKGFTFSILFVIYIFGLIVYWHYGSFASFKKEFDSLSVHHEQDSN